jgi:hypothetical protein
VANRKRLLRAALGGANIPSPFAGGGYVYFDNSAGLLPNQPLGNLLLTFTDINGLERPLTLTGGS